MSPVRFVKSLIVGILICASVCAQTPVVVYEASTNYTGLFHQSANEYGDEIVLDKRPRVITQIQFEYFGDFVPLGDEVGRIRFYANTGPFWRGHTDYPTPAEQPLWEAIFPVRVGFSTATLSVPYIRVPSHFTWTVQFFGIAMTAADHAGLLLYGAPLIGTSFNDYWEKSRNGWTPYRYIGIPKNNFAAKILAVGSAPRPPKLSVALDGSQVRFSWPATANGFYLEGRATANAGVWEPVTPLALRVGDVFQTTISVGAGNRIFRLNSHPQAPLLITAQAGSVRVRWSAVIGGQTLQSKPTLGSAAWTDLPTPTRPTGDYYDVTVPIGSGTEFFRLARKL